MKRNHSICDLSLGQAARFHFRVPLSQDCGGAAAEHARLSGPLVERLEEHECQCRSIKEAHSTVLVHPRLAGRSVLLECGDTLSDQLGESLLVRTPTLAGAGIVRMRHGIRLSPRDRRLAFWGWALGGFLLRGNRLEEALEEARIAARRDPRLYLPPILEAVTQAALGRAELARGALMSARRLRPKLTQQEIERSHGRRAAKILLAVWDVN